MALVQFLYPPHAQVYTHPQLSAVPQSVGVPSHGDSTSVVGQTSVGGGVPLGEGLQPVPLKVAERIWAWDFIDMADLLPEQCAVKRDEPLVAQLMPARKRRQVNDINVWVQCFLAYVSVMSRRFLLEVAELLADMSHIHRASLEFMGTAWVQYDTVFRRQAGCRRWSTINASLYSMCFTGRAVAGKFCELCFSTAHMARECGMAADDVDVAYGWWMVKSVVASLSGPPPAEQRASGSRPLVTDGQVTQSVTEVCRRFNAGKCNFARCARRHVCSACHGQHPSTTCPRSCRPYPG